MPAEGTVDAHRIDLGRDIDDEVIGCPEHDSFDTRSAALPTNRRHGGLPGVCGEVDSCGAHPRIVVYPDLGRLLPIAFVLSIVALFLKGRKWPAITGLIVSIVGTIVGVVVFFTVVSTSFGEAFEELDGAIAEASEAAEEIPEVDEPAEEAEPEPVGNLAFGDTMIWEDDVELTVSAPEGYTPSEYAAGADLPNNIVFTMTITNNSSENLEPLPYARLSSGGQEASQIFDFTADGEDVGVPPTTVILPGQSVTWQSAWSAADRNSLTMQVSPSFAYEDAVFTNLQ